MAEVKLAVIGGSGIYDMEGLTDVEERRVATPFGDPSDTLVIGTLAGHLCLRPRCKQAGTGRVMNSHLVTGGG